MGMERVTPTSKKTHKLSRKETDANLFSGKRNRLSIPIVFNLTYLTLPIFLIITNQ